VQLYHVDSPRRDSRGATPDASSGALRNSSDREVFSLPVFAENRFEFGKFSITPGIRVENIWQDVNEKVNVDKTGAGRPLDREEDSNTILLGGVGLEYEIPGASAVYGNVSQSYRPRIFTQAVPTGPTAFVNEDLEEGKGLEYELGVRGKPTEWLTYDASAFLLSFRDQIGTVAVPGGTSLENVGDAIHKGIDLSLNVDLLTLACGLKSENSLDWFVNATVLDAEFTDGPQDGNTPQYAPDYILRSGFIYTHGEKGKISLLGTLLDDHFGDDANTNDFKVPGYLVLDLTAEYLVHENVRILAGVNNLLDESYYARVTGGGIDPANGRNYYVGLSLEF
ncbi:MAG: TonB-dependent receptor, partial [Armatimonadetes bacterium]|nr:TonB-dependent receptor [Akkermansiaceae bacterium]